MYFQGELFQKEKREHIGLRHVIKSPYTHRKSKKQCDNTKTQPKTSITQRLRTEFGKSVGVTTATQLMWINR